MNSDMDIRRSAFKELSDGLSIYGFCKQFRKLKGKDIDIYCISIYPDITKNSLQGRVQVPTGGKAHEP